MKASVIVFPGSNCDRDAAVALEAATGQAPAMVWHGDSDIPASDLIVLPGGFSYGDYLRSGAMAAHSPVMREVVARARAGTPVLGICNGFQVLTEAGLLPGVLMRNSTLKFICRDVLLRVERNDSLFTHRYAKGRSGSLSHRPQGRQLFRRRGDARPSRRRRPRCLPLLRRETGAVTDAANPNGSRRNIAGIYNETGTVLGLMPHPERLADASAQRHRRRQDVPLAGGDAPLNIAARAAKAAEGITPEIVAEHGLSPDEYKLMVGALGREPSLTELGIFSVMWSEHCSYKSSQSLAEEAPDRRPASDPGPGRERGRGRSRRRPGGGVQDGEPQPPVLYRALSGRGDRRRRHHARRVHHGRAPDRQHERAAIRRA